MGGSFFARTMERQRYDFSSKGFSNIRYNYPALRAPLLGKKGNKKSRPWTERLFYGDFKN